MTRAYVHLGAFILIYLFTRWLRPEACFAWHQSANAHASQCVFSSIPLTGWGLQWLRAGPEALLRAVESPHLVKADGHALEHHGVEPVPHALIGYSDGASLCHGQIIKLTGWGLHWLRAGPEALLRAVESPHLVKADGHLVMNNISEDDIDILNTDTDDVIKHCSAHVRICGEASVAQYIADGADHTRYGGQPGICAWVFGNCLCSVQNLLIQPDFALWEEPFVIHAVCISIEK